MSDTLIKFAKYYASVKHAGQSYSGGLPYTHHLAAVAAVLNRFGSCGANIHDGEDVDAMYASAWLHDVVEDTGTKLKEIEEMFGPRVAHLVGAVTNEKGENRKTRHALTYPKTREAGPLAVRLKLADRIANVEAGGTLVKMYQKEYEDFRRNLYTAGQNEDMWGHLDELLLPPKQPYGLKKLEDGRFRMMTKEDLFEPEKSNINETVHPAGAKFHDPVTGTLYRVTEWPYVERVG